MVLEACTFNQTLAIEQVTDPDIKTIFEYLEKSDHPLFELRNGLVYRKSNDRLLFYVPTDMYELVICSCHYEMCHVGENKTIELIKQIYWFPKLTERVKKYVSSCLQCIIFSPKEGKDEGLLNLIDKGNKQFKTIHIDHFIATSSQMCSHFKMCTMYYNCHITAIFSSNIRLYAYSIICI